MTIFLMILGTLAALSTDSKKPANTNYSCVAITAICFAIAAYLEVHKL